MKSWVVLFLIMFLPTSRPLFPDLGLYLLVHGSTLLLCLPTTSHHPSHFARYPMLQAYCFSIIK